MYKTIKRVMAVYVTATVLPVLAFAPTVRAASNLMVDFEPPTYVLNSTVDGVDGWSSKGAAGSGCAVYDHRVSSSLGVAGFGTQSLRISNAVTSGCFGDQTFSKSLVDEAGETTAQGGGMSGGTRQPYFEAEWDFASTVPGAEQPGLSVVASPDRGDGARMSWVQMTDSPTGLVVNFYDYQTGPGFVQTNVASSLDRTAPHKIKVTMQFVDGVQNDIVKVYVDGVLKHTGTSWEDYFRDLEANPSRTVDSVLFRTSGVAVPATYGKGFLIDNLNLKSSAVPPVLVGPPTDKDQCKNDGWKTFNNPSFKNQGDCVSYVASKGKAKGNPVMTLLTRLF